MIDPSQFTLNCSGDAVTGDTILFEEAVWPAYKPSGRFGRGKASQPLGTRRIVARIVADSYGAAKQQHTFTLQVIESDGYRPLDPATVTARKGRNIYRNGTRRMPWENEANRTEVAVKKHTRGATARAAREERREADRRNP